MSAILKYLKGSLTPNKLVPKNRGIYVVLRGTYSGEYLVFIKADGEDLKFYSIIDKTVHDMTIEIFQRGIKNNIIEFVQVLPQKVYSVVENEFKTINNKDGLRRT